jgi:hypothetical protein
MTEKTSKDNEKKQNGDKRPGDLGDRGGKLRSKILYK